MSVTVFWEDCLSFFKHELPAQQFNNWISPLLIELNGDLIVISTPNSFIQKIIQERFIYEITQRAIKFFPFKPSLELRILKQTTKNIKLPENNIVNLPASTASSLSTVQKSQNKLNSSALFSNYVTGKANQLAHAAAIQVADSPGLAYNPLFIYGGVGLGKTHLIQAIGNQLKTEHPEANICYIHATNYISDVVKAFQNKKFDELKSFYNSLDLLLIDDIQFIADKPGTQQEFFYTLNSLIDSNKQVVITCDTFPKEILGIEPRLTSRFTCGLTVAVEPPGLEMRVAILLQKSKNFGNSISEDVAFFIAKHVRSNVRELEGALNRIDAFARFHKRVINVELAKEALKDLLAAQHKQISIDNIQKTVADFYRIKLADLLSKKRTRMYARPRQIAMCLARELTQLSLPEIGLEFGGRDHSTVLHACKNIENLRKSDSTINSDFLLLNQTLRN